MQRLGVRFWSHLLSNADPGRQRQLLGLFLAAFTVLWTVYASVSRSNLDLHADMVENFSWSRELQLGYFKHPPFFAWVVATWFKVFPTEDWAYFLLSFANVALAFAGIWALIGLFDRSPRRFAAIVALSLTPFYTFSAIKFNANTMLLPVWPWLAWATIRAVRDDGVVYAVAAGVLAAIAMLSKYVSLVMLATLFVASFSIPGWREFYRSRRFPAMVVAFLVALAPHLAWLHQTGYTTFAYVDTNKAESWSRLVRASVSFVVAQIIWLAPMLIIVAIATPRRWERARSALRWRSATPTHRLWLVLLFGPLAFTLLAAWLTFTRLSAPWGIPLWFAASTVLLYAPDFEDGDLDIVRLLGVAGAVGLAALLIAPVVRVADYWTANSIALEPRREAAELLSELWRKRTGKPLTNVAGSQSYASSATFYAPDHPSEFVRFEARYAPWMTPERLRTGGLAIICANDDRTCTAAAARYSSAAAERISVSLAKSFLWWRGPSHTLHFIIEPPKP